MTTFQSISQLNCSKLHLCTKLSSRLVFPISVICVIICSHFLCHAQPCNSDDTHRKEVWVRTETKWAHVHTYCWYMCCVTVRNVGTVCWLHTEQLALLLAAALTQHRATELCCNVGSKSTHLPSYLWLFAKPTADCIMSVLSYRTPVLSLDGRSWGLIRVS